MRGILFAVVLVVSVFVQADDLKPMGFSAAEMQYMATQNDTQADLFELDRLTSHHTPIVGEGFMGKTLVRPFAEYEDAGYLIFSAKFGFDSKKAKLEMAKNLPDGVDLIIYTQSTSPKKAAKLKSDFSEVLSPDRLKVVYMPGNGSPFWSRDAVPVPVIRTPKNGSGDKLFTVVDAPYYHRYEPDDYFAELFVAELTKHSFYYEGGNFIANKLGDCLVVNTSATAKIPDGIFRDHYGCRNTVRLPHVKGIGHADESVKFVDDKTVLTDEISYVDDLEAQGFDVVMLPRPSGEFETYVNSLFINGVVYVPIFNKKSDSKALKVYEDLGFEKVIGLDSAKLSNRGMGSLHCITMTYPPGPLDELLESTGAKILH